MSGFIFKVTKQTLDRISFSKRVGLSNTSSILCLFQNMAEKIEEWEQLTCAFTANPLNSAVPHVTATDFYGVQRSVSQGVQLLSPQNPFSSRRFQSYYITYFKKMRLVSCHSMVDAQISKDFCDFKPHLVVFFNF